MKRIFIAASLIATTLFSAQAQDAPTITAPLTTPIVSKRGYAILPEAGDWSLSIDASTSLRYVGQLFNGSNTNSAPFNYPFNQSVLVRKFIDANTAYRGIVGINMTSVTTKNLVTEAGSTATPPALVEDKRRQSSTQINIGVGLEKRKGISRVQGIYGAQAMIGFGGSGTSFTYGNAFNSTTTPVSTTNFDNSTEQTVATRTLSNKNGKTFSFSILAFGGVEYFFAPKISLGGEFAWGPTISMTSRGKVENESLVTGASQTTTTETAGASSLGLSLQNASGSLRLNFYF